MVRVELEHAREVHVRALDVPGLEERHAAAEAAVDVVRAAVQDVREVPDRQVPELGIHFIHPHKKAH